MEPRIAALSGPLTPPRPTLGATGASVAGASRPEAAMDDLIYLGIGIALFALAAWLACRGSDRPAGGRP